MISIPKLPKELLADPSHGAVVDLLTRRTGLLWEQGRNPVATLRMTDALAAELRNALSTGLAYQGLELATEKLASEQRGLDALSKKAPNEAQNARVSRLLFMADDGSTRFYRDCDSLLSRYSQRLLGCRLEVGGEAFGTALLGAPKMLRSVLVSDKKICARALLALLRES